MSVTMTQSAATHVQNFLTKRGKGIGLRLGVKTTGCSGMAYKLEYADTVENNDQVFESFGVKLLVDPKSLPYIDSTELDFVREGLNKDLSSITRMSRMNVAVVSRLRFNQF